jgi:hypothetical protein
MSSLFQIAQVFGYVHRVLAEHLQRNQFQDRLVGGGEYDRGGDSVVVVTHQRSPGRRPGKRNRGMGVIRSLPIERWWSRNSTVTTAQIVWLPRSSGPVLQEPSR